MFADRNILYTHLSVYKGSTPLNIFNIEAVNLFSLNACQVSCFSHKVNFVPLSSWTII